MFSIPGVTISKGSVLDTTEESICLNDILPTGPYKYRKELMETYVAWLGTNGPVNVPEGGVLPASLTTKLGLLYMVGEALNDEVFCEQVTQQVVELIPQSVQNGAWI